MLCTLRIRVPTRVLAVPVLWPWTESIDLGVPLREHNRSRGPRSTTKYVLTRFAFPPPAPSVFLFPSPRPSPGDPRPLSFPPSLVLRHPLLLFSLSPRRSSSAARTYGSVRVADAERPRLRGLLREPGNVTASTLSPTSSDRGTGGSLFLRRPDASAARVFSFARRRRFAREIGGRLGAAGGER